MLEPRESDIPALCLVLVVLPLFAYILLGKWSESAKKSNRITLLAQLAADEALRAEEMAVADVIPLVSSSKSGLHACARCSAPAKTRCSRCKSIRYCSGNCQIIHWRQVHKHECQQLENHRSTSSSQGVSVDESYGSGLPYENMNMQFFGHNLKHTIKEKAPSDNLVQPPIGMGESASADCDLLYSSQASAIERKMSHKSNSETWRRDNGTVYDASIESSGYNAASSPLSSVVTKDELRRQKSRNKDSSVLEEETRNKVNASGCSDYICEPDTSRSRTLEVNNYQSHQGNAFIIRSNPESSGLSNAVNSDEPIDECEANISTKGGNIVLGGNCHSVEAAQLKCSSEMTVKGSVKAKKISHAPKTKCSKSPNSSLKTSEVAGIRDTIPSQGGNGAASTGIMKMMGLRKSVKHTSVASTENSGDNCKKMKMLFPYEEFVKLFQSEVFGLCPRGLLNCGNSCYANAVLQCLTSTKPLVIYLLCRSHSKSCRAKEWCLMCELEQHIMMLREIGGPLSPSRILWHMRSINCQMGDGSQEDAHEFLRLLVTSMQSICLEGLGGEKKVDPRLQETTFVQHTFGGRLQSKVKCLKCNHESERYENIMDLTLEILGWVESLQDALTQFTSPEDLDGENMYRCGRCTAYVRARKQLSVHEAPNILTIVLKRFQEGRYGKINKCITFPEMLDMVPFMTGTGDIPPLYMLYGVVVHLDTLNASFSGHYISYVKDLQGNWFRIDDTEVQPVSTSEVMSEGAYILFYMRSCPRPQLAISGKAFCQPGPDSSKHYQVESQKPYKSGHCRQISMGHSPELRPEIATHFVDASNGFLRHSTNRNTVRVTEAYSENISRDFSDATSSDWSLFTSSDDASFTTESRDSFSTVDYSDSSNMDPISSFFNYTSENSGNPVYYNKFSSSRPLAGFFPEPGCTYDAGFSGHPLERSPKTSQSRKLNNSSMDTYSNGNCGMYVYYGSNPTSRTSSQCEL